MTVLSTLARGQAIGHGTDGTYYRLRHSRGESHVRRLDLATEAREPHHRRSITHFGHLTDLHVLDPASPGRLEFAQRLYRSTTLELSLILPSYRPQEFLQLRAAEAMMGTLSSAPASPITGSGVQFLLCTGDLIDNAQSNELIQGLRLFEGGSAVAWQGGPEDEGVASARWPDTAYWHPGRRGDEYKRRWGFPTYEDLLAEAVQPIELQGTSLPWLSAHGNHDALVLGTAVPNADYEDILIGTEKGTLLPRAFNLKRHLDLFIRYPELFISGCPTIQVRPDARRHTVDRHEYLRAHLEASGLPKGHGFTENNVRESHCYFVSDHVDGLRLIVLDTVNAGGHYRGSIGERQFAWLEERLEEVHSCFWSEAGRPVTTPNQDRVVVICSHHGIATLTNDLADAELESDLPRVLGPRVEALLHRFPNTVLWVNGHTHRNRVRPRPDPSGRTPGFWEVTTSSLIDWPCQSRLIEIVGNGDGTLSIVSTMVDHDAPADPREADGVLRLAAIHRELAANDPHAGFASGKHGETSDRNVELVIPSPFQLD
jgi:metallophosphoesterase (TIGR03767 family)